MIDFRTGHAEAAQMFDEIVVDLFAGGGGASMGIERALSRAVDVAVNHDRVAVACHVANHPATQHLRTDVWDVDPVEATGGRPVGLLWASPDCRHFSRAKGAKPVSPKVRSLAWVVCKWARSARPRVIILENVREFQDWGPLVGDRPCPERKGTTFRRWVGQLTRLGYAVEWRVLDAADYGAPTHRRRLFVIARRDGRPIVWPEKTHGSTDKSTKNARGTVSGGDGVPPRDREGAHARSGRDDPASRRGVQRNGGRDVLRSGEDRLAREQEAILDRAVGRRSSCSPRPHRTAAECIDWSLPCRSIFDRPRPLADKTLRRIAAGLVRYVLANPRPFIVQTGQQGASGARCSDPADPLTTVVTKAEHCLVVPSVVRCEHGGDEFRGQAVDKPLATITGSGPHGFGLVAATLVGGLVQTGYGERDGQAPRALDVEKPLGSVVAGGAKHAAVAALLTKFYGGVVGHELDKPAGTITGIDHHAVTAAYLTRFYGTNAGSNGDPREPAGTVTAGAGGGHSGVAAVFLARNNHGEKQANDVREPLPTITTQHNKAQLVAAFLLKYYGTGEGSIRADLPIHTVTSLDRFGLVVVELEGEPYIVADIGLRMLSPRELARCQGFPDEYVLPEVQRDAVRLIGNSVCPPVAEALVRGNCGDMARLPRRPRRRQPLRSRKAVVA